MDERGTGNEAGLRGSGERRTTGTCIPSRLSPLAFAFRLSPLEPTDVSRPRTMRESCDHMSAHSAAGPGGRRREGMLELALTRPADGVALVAVRGELDIRTAPELRDTVDGLLREGVRQVLVDVDELDYLDSAGLGTLVLVLRRLSAVEGELVVICQAPRIRRIFEIAGLPRLLTVCNSRTEAFQQIALITDDESAVPDDVEAS